jgi:hypothetical protein
MKEFCLGISMAKNLVYVQPAFSGEGGGANAGSPFGHTDCENLKPALPEGDRIPGNLKFKKVKKPNPV